MPFLPKMVAFLCVENTQNPQQKLKQGENNMEKLCVIYARTSTKQHQSTEYQINYLTKVAERNDWQIADTYVDEGI